MSHNGVINRQENKWESFHKIVFRMRTALRNELDDFQAKAVVKRYELSEPLRQSHKHETFQSPAADVISHDTHFAYPGTN